MTRGPGMLRSSGAARTGWRAHLRGTSLAALAGVLFGALPVHASPRTGADDHPSVLLGEAHGTSALPVSSAAEAFGADGGDAPGRRASAIPRGAARPHHADPRPGAGPATVRLPFGAGLLGLPAAPANAPPAA